MTFDAFAKGLIDRFGQSLPDRWRPSPDYEIMFPTDRGYRDFLQQSLGAPPRSVGTYADIMALTREAVRAAPSLWLAACRSTDGPNPSPGQWATEQYWQSSLPAARRATCHFR